MASDNEASCVCDPNFAIICCFLEKFGKSCGISYPNFQQLQEMIENSLEVPTPLVDFHITLLRKARKSVHSDRWERALVKFCHSYSNQDAWEIERFGYKKARITVKLRALKTLLEKQFDANQKFKTELSKLPVQDLRMEPIGYDRWGHSYWFQQDDYCNLRVYREDVDEETWTLVAKDREGLINLITQLTSNNLSLIGPESIVNEDSNSIESDKLVTDTGQNSKHSSESNFKEDSEKENDSSSATDVKSEKDTVVEEKESENIKKDTSIKEQVELKEEVSTKEELSVKDEISTKDEELEKESIPAEEETVKDERPVKEETPADDKVIRKEDSVVNEQDKSKENNLHAEEAKEMDLSIKSDDTKESNINAENHSDSEEIDDNSEPENLKVDLKKTRRNKNIDVDQIRRLENLVVNNVPSGSSKPHLKAHASLSGMQAVISRLNGNMNADLKKCVASYNADSELNVTPNTLETEVSKQNIGKKRLLKDIPHSETKKLKNLEVGEEIQDPVLVIRGEGSGKECEGVNYDPHNIVSPVGETIEEETFYVYGQGCGADCMAANTGEEDENASNNTAKCKNVENKNIEDKSDSTSSSINKNLDISCTDSYKNTCDTVDNLNVNVTKLNDDLEKTDKSNKIIVAPLPAAKRFLQTVTEENDISVKESCSTENIESKPDNVSNEANEEISEPTKQLFFFGPGSLNNKPIDGSKSTPEKKHHLQNIDDTKAIIDEIDATIDFMLEDLPTKRAESTLSENEKCLSKNEKINENVPDKLSEPDNKTREQIVDEPSKETCISSEIPKNVKLKCEEENLNETCQIVPQTNKNDQPSNVEITVELNSKTFHENKNLNISNIESNEENSELNSGDGLKKLEKETLKKPIINARVEEITPVISLSIDNKAIESESHIIEQDSKISVDGTESKNTEECSDLVNEDKFSSTIQKSDINDSKEIQESNQDTELEKKKEEGVVISNIDVPQEECHEDTKDIDNSENILLETTNEGTTEVSNVPKSEDTEIDALEKIDLRTSKEEIEIEQKECIIQSEEIDIDSEVFDNKNEHKSINKTLDEDGKNLEESHTQLDDEINKYTSEYDDVSNVEKSKSINEDFHEPEKKIEEPKTSLADDYILKTSSVDEENSDVRILNPENTKEELNSQENLDLKDKTLKDDCQDSLNKDRVSDTNIDEIEIVDNTVKNIDSHIETASTSKNTSQENVDTDPSTSIKTSHCSEIPTLENIKKSPNQCLDDISKDNDLKLKEVSSIFDKDKEINLPEKVELSNQSEKNDSEKVSIPENNEVLNENKDEVSLNKLEDTCTNEIKDISNNDDNILRETTEEEEKKDIDVTDKINSIEKIYTAIDDIQVKRNELEENIKNNEILGDNIQGINKILIKENITIQKLFVSNDLKLEGKLDDDIKFKKINKIVNIQNIKSSTEQNSETNNSDILENRIEESKSMCNEENLDEDNSTKVSDINKEIEIDSQTKDVQFEEKSEEKIDNFNQEKSIIGKNNADTSSDNTSESEVNDITEVKESSAIGENNLIITGYTSVGTSNTTKEILDVSTKVIEQSSDGLLEESNITDTDEKCSINEESIDDGTEKITSCNKSNEDSIQPKDNVVSSSNESTNYEQSNQEHNIIVEKNDSQIETECKSIEVEEKIKTSQSIDDQENQLQDNLIDSCIDTNRSNVDEETKDICLNKSVENFEVTTTSGKDEDNLNDNEEEKEATEICKSNDSIVSEKSNDMIVEETNKSLDNPEIQKGESQENSCIKNDNEVEIFKAKETKNDNIDLQRNEDEKQSTSLDVEKYEVVENIFEVQNEQTDSIQTQEYKIEDNKIIKEKYHLERKSETDTSEKLIPDSENENHKEQESKKIHLKEEISKPSEIQLDISKTDSSKKLLSDSEKEISKMTEVEEDISKVDTSEKLISDLEKENTKEQHPDESESKETHEEISKSLEVEDISTTDTSEKLISDLKNENTKKHKPDESESKKIHLTENILKTSNNVEEGICKINTSEELISDSEKDSTEEKESHESESKKIHLEEKISTSLEVVEDISKTDTFEIPILDSEKGSTEKQKPDESESKTKHLEETISKSLEVVEVISKTDTFEKSISDSEKDSTEEQELDESESKKIHLEETISKPLEVVENISKTDTFEKPISDSEKDSTEEQESDESESKKIHLEEEISKSLEVVEDISKTDTFEKPISDSEKDSTEEKELDESESKKIHLEEAISKSLEVVEVISKTDTFEKPISDSEKDSTEEKEPDESESKETHLEETISKSLEVVENISKTDTFEKPISDSEKESTEEQKPDKSEPKTQHLEENISKSLEIVENISKTDTFEKPTSDSEEESTEEQKPDESEPKTQHLEENISKSLEVVENISKTDTFEKPTSDSEEESTEEQKPDESEPKTQHLEENISKSLEVVENISKTDTFENPISDSEKESTDEQKPDESESKKIHLEETISKSLEVAENISKTDTFEKPISDSEKESTEEQKPHESESKTQHLEENISKSLEVVENICKTDTFEKPISDSEKENTEEQKPDESESNTQHLEENISKSLEVVEVISKTDTFEKPISDLEKESTEEKEPDECESKKIHLEEKYSKSLEVVEDISKTDTLEKPISDSEKESTEEQEPDESDSENIHLEDVSISTELEENISKADASTDNISNKVITVSEDLGEDTTNRDDKNNADNYEADSDNSDVSDHMDGDLDTFNENDSENDSNEETPLKIESIITKEINTGEDTECTKQKVEDVNKKDVTVKIIEELRKNSSIILTPVKRKNSKLTPSELSSDKIAADTSDPLALGVSEVKKIKNDITVTNKVEVSSTKPLLMCVDINKLKESSVNEKPNNRIVSIRKTKKTSATLRTSGRTVESVLGTDDTDSTDVVLEPENDPLACSDNEAPKISSVIGTNKQSNLISTTGPTTRKRSREIEVDIPDETVSASAKRRKTKNKRTPDTELRRSIEQQRMETISSDDEKEETESQNSVDSKDTTKSKITRGRPTKKGKGRKGNTQPNAAIVVVEDETKVEEKPPKVPQPRKKALKLLGLDINPEMLNENLDEEINTRSGVRQSRRIAQIKIKEEAERRKIEELTLAQLKNEQKRKKYDDKNYKPDIKKITKYESEDETTTDTIEDKKRKKRKKKKGLKFDESNPWKSSSGSSSSQEEDEVEEEPSDEEVPVGALRSDHEFSPESDLEGPVQPSRRARTAKVESDAETDEYACQHCGKTDHPEWILLCDSCDCGWHCSCLRPALLIIPEGDWFCPPCQHANLITRLKLQLQEFDKAEKKMETEMLKKQRLDYVNVNLSNVLSKEQGSSGEDVGSAGEDSGSSESGSSSSEDSEPIYQLRERRQGGSYRYNEYDELIKSAIQDEMEAVKGAGNQGRGKDISTIVNAEKEEAEENKVLSNETETAENKENVVEPHDGAEIKGDEVHSSEDDIPPVVVRKKQQGKKKHVKLTSLDFSSEEDNPDSDEDFKGSSSEEDDEDYDEDLQSDDSDVGGGRRGKRGSGGPVRRSGRVRTTRYDKDFIDDDDSDEIAPKKKKSRSIWDESESEESDGDWGRKKRSKKQSIFNSPRIKKSKSRKSKHRSHIEDSDKEVKTKVKKRRIKYGGLDDPEDDSPQRRTRGRKINYLEALGTDSEEEVLKKPSKPVIESEDEYVANEEEEDEDDEEAIVDVKNDSENSEPDAEPQIKTQLEPDLAVITKEDITVEDKEPPVISLQPVEIPPTKIALPIANISPGSMNIKPMPAPTRGVGRPRGRGRGSRGGRGGIHKPVAPMIPSVVSEKEFSDDNLEEGEIPKNILKEISQVQDSNDDDDDDDDEDMDMEDMDDEELAEMMMEEEEYANKQLQRAAQTIAKEKRRKEREAKRDAKLQEKLQKKQARLEKKAQKEKEKEQKEAIRLQKEMERVKLREQLGEAAAAAIKEPKKRGRKKKSELESAMFENKPITIANMDATNTLPPNQLEGVIHETSAAQAAVNSKFSSVESSQSSMESKAETAPTVPKLIVRTNIFNTPPLMDTSSNDSPASSPLDGGQLDVQPKRRGRGRGKKSLIAETMGQPPLSNSPDQVPQVGKLGIATPPQPFSQAQPTPSVITRMLQSQPVSAAPQGFSPNITNQKYYGGTPPMVPPHNSDTPPPVRIYVPSPYRHPTPGGPRGPPPSVLPHYPAVSSPHTRPPASLGPPPMYHSGHHPLDPSPSGGGPIAIAGSPAPRDRNSPALVQPAAGSPLNKGTPPPPPYPRANVPMAREYAAVPPAGPSVPPPLRHHIPYQQPSPPRPPGNFAPYHALPPAGYHYGAYVPPPADDAIPSPGYQEQPYPEHYNPPDGQLPNVVGEKPSYDEDTGGEFGGLVSYFSSQREDDLDS